MPHALSRVLLLLVVVVRRTYSTCKTTRKVGVTRAGGDLRRPAPNKPFERGGGRGRRGGAGTCLSRGGGVQGGAAPPPEHTQSTGNRKIIGE